MKIFNLAQNIEDEEKQPYAETNWYKNFQQVKSQITQNDRIHVSSSPDLNLRTSTSQPIAFKPRGLWYAIGDEWINFLTREMQPHKDSSKHVFKLTINFQSMIMIHNAKSLEEFGYKYGIQKEGYMGTEIMNINWHELSKQFSGIEISPYIYSMRLHDVQRWYYPWDVSSGCIWNTSAITNIEKLI